MIHTIKSLTDSFIKFLFDDPVRPNIPHDKRIGDNKEIFVLSDDNTTCEAITCVSYHDFVPQTEEDLFTISPAPKIAVFYTIWSYKPGAGRKLLLDSVDYIKQNHKDVERFVTLSPKTKMADVFHKRNGAIVFRENNETINYEYLNR